MKIISFLASHGGSAARAIIEAIRNGKLPVEVGIVITNNRDSEIYHWCKENGVNVFHVSGKTHPDEAEKDLEICRLLHSVNTSYVILSGYMKKIGPRTLQYFDNKILNMHPSLLPMHGGKGMYGDFVHEAVLKSGDRKTGATVHFVNGEYDEGAIILQQEITVEITDTILTLKQKVQSVEKNLYINVIERLA